MKNILIYAVLILGFIGVQANSNKAAACHAIALVNFNQPVINANDIFVNAASDSPTCGCAPYWLDCEVRCLNEAFDAAPFNPGFHGPCRLQDFEDQSRRRTRQHEKVFRTLGRGPV